MSPPVAVLDDRLLKEHTECPLVALVQHECTLDTRTGQYDCVPFARLFRECPQMLGVRRYEVRR